MLKFHRAAFSFLFFTPVFSTVVFTGYNSTLDTSTCVAPKAYEACYASYVTATAECLAIARNLDEKEACACAGSALQIQCFAEACWNKVCDPSLVFSLRISEFFRYMVANIKLSCMGTPSA